MIARYRYLLIISADFYREPWLRASVNEPVAVDVKGELIDDASLLLSRFA